MSSTSETSKLYVLFMILIIFFICLVQPLITTHFLTIDYSFLSRWYFTSIVSTHWLMRLKSIKFLNCCQKFNRPGDINSTRFLRCHYLIKLFQLEQNRICTRDLMKILTLFCKIVWCCFVSFFSLHSIILLRKLYTNFFQLLVMNDAADATYNWNMALISPRYRMREKEKVLKWKMNFNCLPMKFQLLFFIVC